jgi:hypothetical protein
MRFLLTKEYACPFDCDGSKEFGRLYDCDRSKESACQYDSEVPPKSYHKVLIAKHSDAGAQQKQLYKILYDIEDVAGYTSTLTREVPTGRQ